MGAMAATVPLVVFRCTRRFHHRATPGGTGLAVVPCRQCRDRASEIVIHLFEQSTGALVFTYRADNAASAPQDELDQQALRAYEQQRGAVAL